MGGSPDDSKLDMLRTLAGISSEQSNVLSFDQGEAGAIVYHHWRDVTAPIASAAAPVSASPNSRPSHGDIACVVVSHAVP